jgi:hypothetical protein
LPAQHHKESCRQRILEKIREDENDHRLQHGKIRFEGYQHEDANPKRKNSKIQEPIIVQNDEKAKDRVSPSVHIGGSIGSGIRRDWRGNEITERESQ